MEPKARDECGKVCKIFSLASGSQKFQMLIRMSMMEALGQLAKDGSLLAPTRQHIGAFQYTSFSGHIQLNTLLTSKLIIGFSDYQEALGKSLAGFLPAKYIFKVWQI